MSKKRGKENLLSNIPIGLDPDLEMLAWSPSCSFMLGTSPKEKHIQWSLRGTFKKKIINKIKFKIWCVYVEQVSDATHRMSSWWCVSSNSFWRIPWFKWWKHMWSRRSCLAFLKLYSTTISFSFLRRCLLSNWSLILKNWCMLVTLINAVKDRLQSCM